MSATWHKRSSAFNRAGARGAGRSCAILREALGIPVDTLAYPVGNVNSFTGDTQQLARELGYAVCFSFHGGTNLPGATLPTTSSESAWETRARPAFRVQAAVCRRTASYWP